MDLPKDIGSPGSELLDLATSVPAFAHTSPYALYRLAEIYISVKNDSTTGMSYLDRLIDNFPDSYYLPFGLKEKADILYSSQISVEQAKNIYLQLLEKFTDYPFINDVRERLRNIEENPKAA